MYTAYAQLKDYFGNRMRMCYTDTDAFILHIKSDDIFVELKSHPELRDMFDFSVIPPSHPSGTGEPNDKRAGVVGYFKDECNGKPITELVSLKPKMYSFTTCEPTLYDPEHPDSPPPPIKHKEVAKGIARATIKNKLTHESYLKMYNEGPLELLPNRAIRSKLHTIYTIEVEKRGLHPYDDKRYLLANLEDGSPNPNTHAYGHYSIPATNIPLNANDASNGLVVRVRPPRESIEMCQHKRYIKRHKRVEKKLAALEMDRNEEEWKYDGDNEDINGEEMLDQLNESTLAQAERAAVARPGVGGRLEEAIKRIIAKEPDRTQPNSLEKRDADDHFDGEPAANGRVWRQINGQWVTGLQESISVFVPDAKVDEDDAVHEITLEQFQKELAKEFNEHMVLNEKHCEQVKLEDTASPIIPNQAGTSGWNAGVNSQPSDESPDDDGGAASFDVRSKKRRVKRQGALQFIDSMAAVEGESNSDNDEEEDEEDTTESDDSFIVGDDIFE